MMGCVFASALIGMREPLAVTAGSSAWVIRWTEPICTTSSYILSSRRTSHTQGQTRKTNRVGGKVSSSKPVMAADEYHFCFMYFITVISSNNWQKCEQKWCKAHIVSHIWLFKHLIYILAISKIDLKKSRKKKYPHKRLSIHCHIQDSAR